MVSLTFRSDHVDGGDKILKPSAGDYKDATSKFKKPEWDLSRGGASDSHPISHTKGLTITVDIDIQFTVSPTGQSASLSSVKGVSADGCLSFAASHPATVQNNSRITVSGLSSKDKLPDYVEMVGPRTISWTAVVDGTEISIGSTGPHKVYVTLDTPGGNVESTSSNIFSFTGNRQDVTEERLRFSVEAARLKGQKDEKECVDAIFLKLANLGVGYYLGHKWEPGSANDTGIDPKPTLHHYLWRCNAATAKGQCHNIAAAFATACQILGVKGAFEVGYMVPWSSRSDTPPDYKKRGDQISGRYTKTATLATLYTRNHSGEAHGQEKLMFLDKNDDANNFEGVAKYRNGLYAIGDARFDFYGNDDENASCYFTRFSRTSTLGATPVDRSIGGFNLIFYRTNMGGCEKPYPWSGAASDHHGIKAATFKWHD